MQLRKRVLLILAGIVVCAAIGAVVTRRVGANAPKPVAAQVLPRATIAVVKRAAISNSFTAAGEFLPYQEVELHAKVAGYIRKISVDIGDRVRSGQVLAVLEVPELNAQVMGANAGVGHSREEISRAENEVRRAEADHAALHMADERLQQVSKTRPGLIAQQELDNAMAKDRAAEAQIEAAKSVLAAAQHQLAGSQATHAQVSAMEEYSRIVAPFAGVVTWRYADTGALIQAGTANSNSMPVVKVAQVNLLRLRIPVPESVGGKVRVGTLANVQVQATGERFSAKVARLTNSFDRSTRTMQVEVDVPNEKNKLSPGMYADVTLVVENRPDALTVPVMALNRANDKTTVLAVDQENRVAIREIHTGLEDPNSVEVLAGLSPGDRVIVGNLGTYRPGQPIDPKPSNMEPAATKVGGEQ
jgi:RND family efflux transporter MFP subunit